MKSSDISLEYEELYFLYKSWNVSLVKQIDRVSIKNL